MLAAIYVHGNNGYVWDAGVAHWLRLECGLVGAAVGGVAAFKQQNAVHGLPLELSPEEVTLILERGWGELQPALATAAQAAALARGGGSGSDAGSRKRPRQTSAYQYYEEEEEDLEDLGGGPGDGPGGSGEGEGEGQGAAGEPAGAAGGPAGEPAEPTWRAALAGGSSFDIPTTPAEAAAANSGATAPVAATAPAEGAAEGAAAVEWTFPSTAEERHRYWVFRDLHAKGYRLTGGSKFGSDFLVYPGDPSLYHAQFCVRLLPFRQAILPAMLASATRGSHQARKHLLIASVVEGEGQQGEGEERQGAGGSAAGGHAAAGPSSSPGMLGAADGDVGAANGSLQKQKQQQEQQQQEQQQQLSVQPLAGSGTPQLGAHSGGTGSRGEQYRIRYMTIGPVEGFG